ncbi:LrgB family protein [Massilia arenosa]|uniref:LrgB family protein n=1 Tax=Zemynaea arenosa TaxID=2561931 RepID=A0A4Y9SAZ8_9BURK|nr:LrgB family protein [Massilia arenosa]TFW19236.1 LrgB family protein [Massilia arenosa]
MFRFAELSQFWVYLSASPLLGLTLTLCAYIVAQWIYLRCRMSPLANPVAIAIVLISAVLALSGMSYQRYFAGAQFVHFLLGPATVALAVPLARQVPRLRRSLLPLGCALLCGCVTAIVTAAGVAALLGAPEALVRSIAPKSATTPIAMAVAQSLGGIPALTAALVIATGILGAATGRFLFNALRIESIEARGFALGLAAHGIGTARAFQVSAQAGAFAALGMGLNGVMTALLAPWLVPLISRWLVH